MNETVKRPTPVLLSKYATYTPGELYHIDIGDRARLHSVSGRPSTIVVVDSELRFHPDAPDEGWVYEVVFTEYDRARVAVAARQLEYVGGSNE